MKKVFESLSDEFMALQSGIDRQDDFAHQYAVRTLGKPYYSASAWKDRGDRLDRKFRLGQILSIAQRRWKKANRKAGDICPPCFPYGHPLRFDFGTQDWRHGFLARIGKIQDRKTA
ncbi:MAG: hypothetical protein ABTS22_20040 [Accumulibacter sp.]|uniref:hypothetical protein n=1 Tax=Accumulibacter sp. TaxID=2053492 RepID=UPI0033150210